VQRDLDGDGVPDAEDACPAQVGEPRPPRPGCPPDQDDDGIYDMDDRCPAEAGVASADPAKNGCPADTDGDSIPDRKDACPAERGEPTQDPATNGCPRAVRVETEQIVLMQQVHFATGRADILSDSFDLLGQVAAVMKEHPEIARVAVDGHTDNDGALAANLELSRRRALTVVKWLTQHGVDARRLEARGFGPQRPIADNATEPGRAKNRRVEFLIRRRTPEGEAGWRDGPMDE
jgi:outer membrane protein OmpA-like peptidoglycan-associated protein